MSLFRKEKDLLGELDVPANAYYGVQTQRAVENFRITGRTLQNYPTFIKAMAQVKKAAALANKDCKALKESLCDVITKVCDELIAGKLQEHFVVDMVQGGAGTSTNMNINEVIANRGLELLGMQKGQYEFLHPNDHVNCSQSTNDAYPTFIKVALYEEVEMLLNALEKIVASFRKKSKEFKDFVKMGRTQLQDAVPMTLGQEFAAFASGCEDDISHLKAAQKTMRIIHMGGTAIGTGFNCAAGGYPDAVVKHLSKICGGTFVKATDFIEATQSTSDLVYLSSTLKRAALRISKVCSDLRLLSSGPKTGLGEISLPAMQPGSTIMPGKINPVIPEVVNQIAFFITGMDTTISIASEHAQLQLNVFEPVIAYGLFEGISMLQKGYDTLREKCLDGIQANPEHCKQLVLNSAGIATALNPILGYTKTSEIVKAALKTNRTVIEVVLEKGYMSKEELEKVLQIERLVYGPDSPKL